MHAPSVVPWPSPMLTATTLSPRERPNHHCWNRLRHNAVGPSSLRRRYGARRLYSQLAREGTCAATAEYAWGVPRWTGQRALTKNELDRALPIFALGEDRAGHKPHEVDRVGHT